MNLSKLTLSTSWDVSLAQLVSSSVALPAKLVNHFWLKRFWSMIFLHSLFIFFKQNLAFLAAMSSSRSDDVTKFVRPSVRMSPFSDIEAFEANLDVLKFLMFPSVSPVFHLCFTGVSPVFHRCFSSVSPVFYQSFTSVLPMFHQCFTRVSPVF